MKLSNNFYLSEFEESQTALNRGIDNTIPTNLIIKAQDLTDNILQPLREYLNASIHITSGYRCIELNTIIGGAKNSQHTKGEAVDFICSDNAKAFEWIKNNCKFDQLIWEYGDDNQPKWVHVSFSENNRNQTLRV